MPLSFVIPVLAALVEVTPPEVGETIDLVRVRDEAREVRRSLSADERVEIVFAPGVYTVTNTLELSRADSRTVWRAAEKGRVRFRGGVAVPQKLFREETVNGVKVRTADVRSLIGHDLAPWPKDFRVPPGPWLYRNNAPLEIARWPNDGNWMVASNAVVSAGVAAASKDGKSDDSIRCSDPRAKTWDFAKGIWFYGYWCHDWAESFVQGASYDEETEKLTFSGRHHYGFGGKTWGFAGRRYFALNALSELDAPGEWYLDRVDQKLFVVPQEGEKSAKYVLATLERPFVKAVGLVDVTFEGFVFETSHAATAVVLDDSERVRMTACTFANLGGTALQLTGKDSEIRNCRFGNLGKGGIILSGGDRKTLGKGNLVVADCAFRKWGRFVRTYTPGVLVMGCGQVVRGSTFRDAPHNAILFKGNDHLIEGNEFDRVLMDTGDAGAVYTGRNPSEMGTMIRGNYFHDLGDPTKRTYTSAVYFDDCDWGDSVVSNRFERLGRGVLLGGGNLFRIEGNVFTDCLIGIHIDSRGVRWPQWTEHPDWFEKAFAEFRPFNDAWRMAYPQLETTLGDTPFAPWNNTLIGNRFEACTHNTQFDAGVNAVTNRFPCLR